MYRTERKIACPKMQKRGWIEWRPGKGRGHVSYIRLLADYDAVVIAEAKNALLSNHLMRRFNSFKPIHAHTQAAAPLLIQF